MASHVHYKFKSAKNFDSVSFSGTVISLFDLKRAIVEAKNLHKGMDFDLKITNAQTNEEYTDDSKNITKNTSVIVRRVPAPRNKSGGLLAKMKALAQASATMSSTEPVGGATSTVASNVSQQTQAAAASSMSNEPMSAHDEEKAIEALNAQAATHRAPSQYIGNKTWTASGGSNANRISNYNVGLLPQPSSTILAAKHGQVAAASASPPPMYVCKRCNISGHFVKDCPTNGDPAYDNARRKRTLGVPATMLKVVDEQKGGGLVDAQGRRVTIKSNKEAFTKLKDMKGGGGGAQEQLLEHLSAAAPTHLKCPICVGIVQDSVLVPCCQASVCDACIRQELTIQRMKCPLCMRPGLSPDQLMPNLPLRAAVDDFVTRMTKDTRARADLDREAAQILQQAEFESAQAAAAASMSSNTNRSTSSKRRSNGGVDAILELGPRQDRSKSDDGSDDALDDNEFGADVYDTTLTAKEKEAPPEVPKLTEKEAEVIPDISNTEDKVSSAEGEAVQAETNKSEEREAAEEQPNRSPCASPTQSKATKGSGVGWKGWEKERGGGSTSAQIEHDDFYGGSGNPWANMSGEFPGQMSQPGPWMMMGPRPWVMGPPIMGAPSGGWGMVNPSGGWGPMGSVDGYYPYTGRFHDTWAARGGRGRSRNEWMPDSNWRFGSRMHRSRSRSPRSDSFQGYGSLAQGRRRVGRDDKDYSKQLSRQNHESSRSLSPSRRHRKKHTEDQAKHPEKEEHARNRTLADRKRKSDPVADEDDKVKQTVAVVVDDGSDSARERSIKKELPKEKLRSSREGKRSSKIESKKQDSAPSTSEKSSKDARGAKSSKQSAVPLEERVKATTHSSHRPTIENSMRVSDSHRAKKSKTHPSEPLHHSEKTRVSDAKAVKYVVNADKDKLASAPKDSNAEKEKSSHSTAARTDAAEPRGRSPKPKSHGKKSKKDKKNHRANRSTDEPQHRPSVTHGNQSSAMNPASVPKEQPSGSAPSRKSSAEALPAQDYSSKPKATQPAATVASAAAAAAAAAASTVQAQHHSLKGQRSAEKTPKSRMVSLVGIKSTYPAAGAKDRALFAVDQELESSRKKGAKENYQHPSLAQPSDFYTKKKRKESDGAIDNRKFSRSRRR